MAQELGVHAAADELRLEPRGVPLLRHRDHSHPRNFGIDFTLLIASGQSLSRIILRLLRSPISADPTLRWRPRLQ